ncbi:MAG: LysR substrate-binding domain-containing protein [Deferribacterales bacterium]
MNITIRQIETFYYTAKLGSLSLAADKLCITQAAASMALKEFEHQMGEQLFERAGKKLILNGKGSAILETTAEILSKSCELATFFSEKPCLCGNVILGTIPSIANYVMPEYITSFIEKNRMGSINIHIGNSQTIIDRVLRFEDDAGIIDKCCCQPTLRALPWLKDELAICVSPNHPLADKEEVTKDDLQNCKWIMREYGAGSRRVLEAQIKTHDIKLDVLCEMEHNEAIMTAVAGGDALSCLSKNVLADMIRLNRIKTLNTPFMNMHRQFYFIIHQDKYRPRLLREFMKHMGLEN